MGGYGDAIPEIQSLATAVERPETSGDLNGFPFIKFAKLAGEGDAGAEEWDRLQSVSST